MVKILEEYTGERGDGDILTETWVNLLVSMTDLNSEHVERLEDSNKGITKYRLSENLLSTLNKTAVELQVFVERAAGLIEERTRLHGGSKRYTFTLSKRDLESPSAKRSMEGNAEKSGIGSSYLTEICFTIPALSSGGGGIVIIPNIYFARYTRRTPGSTIGRPATSLPLP